jgi:hypothetical protein
LTLNTAARRAACCAVLAGALAVPASALAADTTPPTVSITAPAAHATVGTMPQITFDAADDSGNAPTTVCQVDGQPSFDCWSDYILFDLVDEGPHTVTVTATDDSGNSASDQVTFDVDATGPTVITDAPESTNLTNLDIAFSSPDGDLDHFECAVDDDIDAGNFAPCTSPYRLTGLDEGLHQLTILAVDTLGNHHYEGVVFNIDRTAPALTLHTAPDEGARTRGDLPIEWSATEGIDPTCQIDGADVGCTSNYDMALSGLSEGTHTFRVRGRDHAGNLSDWASRSFIVDRTAPALAIASPAASVRPTISGTAGTATGDNGHVDLYVVPDTPDAEPVAVGLNIVVDGSGAWTYTPDKDLPAGKYVAWVFQDDAAGNFSEGSVKFEVVAPRTEQPQTPQPQPQNPPAPASPAKPQAPAAPKMPATPQASVLLSTVSIANDLAAHGIEGLTDDGADTAGFLASGPGSITVTYTAPASGGTARAAKTHQVVVAKGSKTVGAAGAVTIRVKLTAAGRKLLKHSKRVAITVTTAFTPMGAKKAATTHRKVTVKAKAKKR